MADSVPSCIELSPTQREILELIVQDQASIQKHAEPERAILLWSEGASESTTAQQLGISEEEVKTLRHCWWASRARIAAAERKLDKTFNDLVTLVFRVPNEEPNRQCPKHYPQPKKGRRTERTATCTTYVNSSAIPEFDPCIGCGGNESIIRH